MTIKNFRLRNTERLFIIRFLNKRERSANKIKNYTLNYNSNKFKQAILYNSNKDLTKHHNNLFNLNNHQQFQLKPQHLNNSNNINNSNNHRNIKTAKFNLNSHSNNKNLKDNPLSQINHYNRNNLSNLNKKTINSNNSNNNVILIKKKNSNNQLLNNNNNNSYHNSNNSNRPNNNNCNNNNQSLNSNKCKNPIIILKMLAHPTKPQLTKAVRLKEIIIATNKAIL